MTTESKTGPSPLRAIARWATAFAEWEEGRAHSPSATDLVLYYQEEVGELAVDPTDAFYDMQCHGATLEELAQFLAECEHVQPHRQLPRS